MPLASMIATWTMISLSRSAVLTMVWKSVGVLAGLDGAPQIEQRLVDLADRAQHVLLEHHREIAVGALGLALVAANVLNIFEADAAPQHGDDHHAEDRRASTLGDKSRELRQMQFHGTQDAPVPLFAASLRGQIEFPINYAGMCAFG